MSYLYIQKASLAPLTKDFELEDSNDAKPVEPRRENKNAPGCISAQPRPDSI